MGLRCSCLEHSQKYHRRPSDDLDTVSMELASTDRDQELEVLVEAQETHELLGAKSRSISGGWNGHRGVVKQSGSIVGAGLMAEVDRRDDEDEKKHSLSLRLNTDHHLTPLFRPGELLRLLRLYQEITGVIDEGQLELECIMCLDIFSENNPKVRTLCKCGINRTNFHMSCLLEWLNRGVNCPVCREYLFFEDA